MTSKDLRVLFKMAVKQPCNQRECVLLNNEYNPSKKILQNIRLESKPKEVLDKQGGSSHPFWRRCCTEQRALDNLATSAAAQGNVKPNGQLKTASITLYLRKSLPTDTVLLISSAARLFSKAPSAIALGQTGPSLPQDLCQSHKSCPPSLTRQN